MPTKPRTDAVLVRLGTAERRDIRTAARRDGLPVSTWVRRVAVAAAKRANADARLQDNPTPAEAA